MKRLRIEAQPREELGKSATKAVRKAEMAPAVIYTPEGPVHIVAEAKVLNTITYNKESHLIELVVDGKAYLCILKEAQYHPMHHDELLHMDFQQVFPDKPVIVALPVDLIGTSPGVVAGGRLVQKQRRLKVMGLYPDLPERLQVSISDLQLGRSIKAGDLSFDKFSVRMNADVAIASCEITRALRQEAAAAGK